MIVEEEYDGLDDLKSVSEMKKTKAVYEKEIETIKENPEIYFMLDEKIKNDKTVIMEFLKENPGYADDLDVDKLLRIDLIKLVDSNQTVLLYLPSEVYSVSLLNHIYVYYNDLFDSVCESNLGNRQFKEIYSKAKNQIKKQQLKPQDLFEQEEYDEI